jgi:hypothetical protein
MGAPRFCCRKLEYGSNRDSSVPSKLKTLTTCAEVPLSQPDVSQASYFIYVMTNILEPKERDFCQEEKRRKKKNLHCKDREMLMRARRAKRIPGRLERP